MTRRMARNLSLSSSIKSQNRKHRRRAPKEIVYDDYSERSGSQSRYQTEEEEDDEDEIEKPTENTDDDSYTDPGSETNRPATYPISSPPLEPNSRIPDIFSSNSAWDPPISYMNIAPIPIFRGAGDECPITHLSRFTKMCRANNAPSFEMMMRIFPVTLENEPLLWYDLNIEPYPSLTWEEIKSSFVEAYSKIGLVDELRSELMAINQGGDESVRSYFLRLQWILKKWPDNDLSENLIKGIFLDGLKKDFQNWIVPQKPGSLNDALRLAFNWEQVRCIRGVQGNAPECGFCSGVHEESDCEIRERLRELWLRAKEKRIGSLAPETREERAAVERGCGSGREGGEELMVGGRKKKSQCVQCRKKKFERNNSTLSMATSSAY